MTNGQLNRAASRRRGLFNIQALTGIPSTGRCARRGQALDVSMKLAKSSGKIVVLAPAKLNLFLRVLGKRSDGFHELQTLICPVSLFDTITLQAPCEHDGLSVNWVPGGAGSEEDRQVISTWNQNNLIVRAVELFRARSGIDSPVQIGLRKRIPPRAGLGGGSSDAAAVLWGMSRLFCPELSAVQLAAWAAELGSDVPCFLHTGLCLCTGRGERVQPLGWLPRLNAVVVFPPQGLSTAEVYRHWNESEQGEAPRLGEAVRAWSRGGPAAWRLGLFNSLEPAARKLCPWLGHLRRRLEKGGHLCGQLSGSGSAYFVLCRNRVQARSLARRLAAEGWGRCWAVSTTV